MKLRCRQRPVLHRGEESTTVICPCQCRGGEGRLHLQCPLLRCERVYEIESLTGKTVKEHRPRIGFNGVPSHMRQHRCIQPRNRAGPLAPSLRFHTALPTPPSNITCMPTQIPNPCRPPASRRSTISSPRTART